MCFVCETTTCAQRNGSLPRKCRSCVCATPSAVTVWHTLLLPPLPVFSPLSFPSALSFELSLSSSLISLFLLVPFPSLNSPLQVLIISLSFWLLVCTAGGVCYFATRMKSNYMYSDYQYFEKTFSINQCNIDPTYNQSHKKINVVFRTDFQNNTGLNV